MLVSRRVAALALTYLKFGDASFGGFCASREFWYDSRTQVLK